MALGAVVTTVLFFIMQAVIASDEARLDEGAKGKLLELVRLEDDEEIQTKQRKPKPPPPEPEPERNVTHIHKPKPVYKPTVSRVPKTEAKKVALPTKVHYSKPKEMALYQVNPKP